MVLSLKNGIHEARPAQIFYKFSSDLKTRSQNVWRGGGACLYICIFFGMLRNETLIVFTHETKNVLSALLWCKFESINVIIYKDTNLIIYRKLLGVITKILGTMVTWIPIFVQACMGPYAVCRIMKYILGIYVVKMGTELNLTDLG